MDDKIIKSKKDAEIFFNEIEHPSPPNEELKKAAKNYIIE